jgi:hypothetical protein
MVPANVPLGNKHGRLLRHNFGNHASQGWMSSRDESLNDEKFDNEQESTSTRHLLEDSSPDAASN